MFPLAILLETIIGHFERGKQLSTTEEQPLTEIPKRRLDPDVPAKYVIETAYGQTYIGSGVRSPDASVGIEDFGAGDTIRWRFWHAEVHYILKGKAEVTYTLPAWHDEVKTMTVEANDCYVIPRGAELEWKVSPEEPLRKFCVVMPKDPLYDVRPKTMRKIVA